MYGLYVPLFFRCQSKNERSLVSIRVIDRFFEDTKDQNFRNFEKSINRQHIDPTMNTTTRIEVLQLSFSDKELYAQSRKRTGYNVFLSWYVIQFKQLDYHTRKEACIDAGVHSRESYEESENDSVISSPSASYHDIMRMAVRRWRSMGSELRGAWNERAELVNGLPCLGGFEKVPDYIHSDVITGTLNQDYFRFQRMMKGGIRRNYNMMNRNKMKNFGMERFVLGLQVFRNFFMSDLLKFTFFGPHLCFLRKHELVSKTASSSLVHIHSRKRLVSLFTKNELCAFEVADGEMMLSCAGKMVVIDTDTGLETFGYVLDEEEDGKYINVQLANLVTFRCKRPEYLVDMGSWLFDCNDVKYKIKHYMPIRLRMLKSGNCQITFNQFKLSNQNSNKIICF